MQLQLNTCTLVCGFEWSDIVNWCMVARCIQNVRRDGSSFTWHQPCSSQQSCKLVHHLDVYSETRYMYTLIQSHMRVCSRVENSVTWKRWVYTLLLRLILPLLCWIVELFFLCVWNLSDWKGKRSSYAFILNTIVLLRSYCICAFTIFNSLFQDDLSNSQHTLIYRCVS